MHHDPESCHPTHADAAGTSRRRFLGWLAAAPAALGFAIAAEHDAVEARKKKHKKGKRGKRGRKRNGGGYAPDAEEQAFLALINAHRSANGAGPLSLQGQLGAASKQHSQTMASQSSMVHTPNLQAYLLGFGYPAVSWAENIAAGYGTAQQVFIAWKKSAGHNLNMLDPAFTEIGIGRAYNAGSTHDWYWTTELGRR